ncbi:hypothetical protein FHS61_000554 [Altererythrobacter atlanticus]|uniref:Uncharacterized protein n=1 Tax=Croceibacterium atlanticum TaxID=1267766 RepID=A0A0F7KUC0_9SPHN|nr:lasso RiPP family leader peptide-containing protein [Croceibacterium atlanticum]AKH42781.1 hypothetical protein WYH_01745 [Croceibacterium atlanticum]MBB5731561.1 hypothetical protein [Croceibacterium atlanticum]
MTKIRYERPTMEQLGSFETLTQGGSQSGSLDSQYPIGTPSEVGVFS